MAWTENLQVAAVGAAFAVAGYAGKSVVDWWQEKRKERAGIIAKLQGLESLLKASRALFLLQQEQVKRLMKLLETNHPEQFRGRDGYDDAMARCHGVLNDEERALHGIIRAYTEHSLRAVNQAVSDWLKADASFKTGGVPSKQRQKLAELLFALELHLMLWHAKYASWIPGHPEHALVYMADEQSHGLGFPGGLDEAVAEALKELRLKWK
jgi:hypothetical protein